jgi:hypothetical protein
MTIARQHRRRTLLAIITATVTLTSGAVASASGPVGGISLNDLQTLVDRVAEQPDTFAGVSTNGPGEIVVHTIGSDALVSGVIGQQVNTLRTQGAVVTVKAEKYSARQLQATHARVPDSATFGKAPELSTWAVDPSTNSVQVGVTAPTPELAARAKAEFGDLVTLLRRPHLYPASGGTKAAAPLGRLNDNPPLYGGDRITGGPAPGKNCTSGFAVRNRAGLEYMLTAGHCYSEGVTVSANTWLSRVGFRRYGNGLMDHELLENIPGAQVAYTTASGHMWEGGVTTTTSAPVTNAMDSCTGCQVFFGGSYTGKSLATLHGPKTTIRECLNTTCSQFYDVINVQEALGNDPICRHGDSGGPVYAFNNTGITAVGLITAISGTGANENPYDCWYTSVRDILISWDIAIQLGQ